MKPQAQVDLQHRIVLLIAGFNPLGAIGLGKLDAAHLERGGNSPAAMGTQDARHAYIDRFALGVANIQRTLPNVVAGTIQGKKGGVGVDQGESI